MTMTQMNAETPATAYVAKLGQRQIYFQNNGASTALILASTGPSQQQSANRFTTGKWTIEPRLFQIAQDRYVACILASPEKYYYRIQADQQGLQTQVSHAAESGSLAAELSTAKAVPLQPVDAIPGSSMPSMQPMEMQPMKPMTMGNMSMSPMGTGPMSMTMGNMSLSMASMSPDANENSAAESPDEIEAAPESQSKRFCSQCGSSTTPSDRFCAHCGHRLTQ